MNPFVLDASGGGHVAVLVTPTGDCGPQLGILHRWGRESGVDVREIGTSAAPCPGTRPMTMSLTAMTR